LWSVVKPKTPISDESERLALAVTLIREHAECRPSRAIVIIGESRPAKLCFQPARNRVELRDICALLVKADHPRQVCLCQPLAEAMVRREASGVSLRKMSVTGGVGAP